VKHLRLPFKRLDCVSLDSLFVETIEPAIISSCIEYNLTSSDVRDIKRLVAHHLVLHTCEVVLRNTSSDRIVFFTWRDFHKNRESKLVSLLGEDTYTETLDQCIADVKRIFPFKIHVSDKTFEYFTYLYSKRSPISETELRCISNTDTTTINMSRVRKYVSKFKLTFLDEVYFSKIRTKLLLAA